MFMRCLNLSLTILNYERFKFTLRLITANASKQLPFMIKGINITRTSVSSSITNPGQWSDNLQLAINNGIQITLLDPKLPNIHKSIISSTSFTNDAGTNDISKSSNGNDTKNCLDTDKVSSAESTKPVNRNNVLNAKEMFEQSTILHIDLLIQMDVCKFNKLTVTSNNEDFWFSRIGEPLIIKHQWLPISVTNKDCKLAVLLNTGELLIFERGSKQLQDYRLKFNLFDIILKELDIKDAPEISVDYQEFLLLKIKDFNGNKQGETPVLTVLNGKNQVAVYDLSMQLQFKTDLSFDVASYQIRFSPNNALIAFATTDNKVVIYNNTEDSYTTLVESSRFKINKILWHNDTLIFNSTNALYVYSLYKGLSSGELSPKSNVADITVLDDNIIISTEIGGFYAYNFEAQLCNSSSSVSSSLEEFVSTSLLKYQLASNFNNEEITKNYLNMMEGNFLTFSSHTNNNGMFLIIYKIYPRTNINYTIMSRDEFNIGFVNPTPLSHTLDNFQTSLSFISKLWFENFDGLLVFPKNFQITSIGFIEKFMHSLKTFKSKIFKTTMTDLPEYIQISNIPKLVSFESYLIENFTTHPKVIECQRLFNFNEIVMTSNNTLRRKLESFQGVDESIVSGIDAFNSDLSDQQVQIRTLIMRCLISLVFEFVSHTGLEKDKLPLLDEFLLLGYANFYGKSGVSYEERTISFTTDFVSESFTLTKDSQFEELIVSNSGHKWSRCALTLLPLLDFNTKTDELGRFNYLETSKDIPSDSLTFGLLTTLDFCIFTGNKLYKS